MTEAGPSASIIQKYQNRPLLTPAGHKMIFRYSVYLKGIVPLQAFVSKKVQVLNATKPFTMCESNLQNPDVHMCQTTCPDEFYNSQADHDTMTAKSVDAIRAVLKAF